MLDLIAAALEISPEHVGKDHAAAESQVGRPVQAGPAGIDRHLAGRQGLQLFYSAGQRVVKTQGLRHRIAYEQRSGKISLASVRQQGDNRAFAQCPSFIEGHFHGRARAHSYKDPLFPGQAPGSIIRRIVVYVDDGLQFFGLEDPGRVAFLHVLEALNFMTLVGLDADHANGRIEFAQCTGNAHQRSRGSHGNYHDVDFAAGGLPNLLARAVVMGLPVGLVVELVDQYILAGLFAGQAIGFFNGPIRAPVARRQKDLRPIGLENPLAFFACRLAHGDQELVALDRADHGQADGRIAAAGLQHDLARSQLAGGLGLLDHP